MIHLPSTTDHADTIWRWSNATRRFVGKSESSRWRIYDGYHNTGNSLSTRSEFVVRDHDWRYHSFTGFSCWFVNEPNPLIYFQFFIWTLNRTCSWERSGFMSWACLLIAPVTTYWFSSFRRWNSVSYTLSVLSSTIALTLSEMHILCLRLSPPPHTILPAILNRSSISLMLNVDLNFSSNFVPKFTILMSFDR